MPQKGKKEKKSKKAKQAAAHVHGGPPARGAGRTGVKLSGCAKDYTKSLMQPWGPEAPCLPQGFPLPSLKRKFFVRGTFGQGLTTGFVMFNPLQGVRSDTDTVYYSNGNYTGAAFTSSGVGVLGTRLNSTYPAGFFSGASAGAARLVSAGIRVRYDGTELNRGGRLIPFEHPQHGSVSSFIETQLLSMQGVVPVRPSSDGKWVTVVSSGPKEEFELAYTSDVVATGQAFLGIMINGGVAPTGVSPSATANFVCEFECWGNYEIIGPVLSGQTPSHHDPVGASMGAAAVSAAQQAHPHSSSPGFGESVGAFLGKMGQDAVTTLWNHRDEVMDVGKAALTLL